MSKYRYIIREKKVEDVTLYVAEVHQKVNFWLPYYRVKKVKTCVTKESATKTLQRYISLCKRVGIFSIIEIDSNNNVVKS